MKRSFAARGHWGAADVRLTTLAHCASQEDSARDRSILRHGQGNRETSNQGRVSGGIAAAVSRFDSNTLRIICEYSRSRKNFRERNLPKVPSVRASQDLDDGPYVANGRGAAVDAPVVIGVGRPG